MADTLLVTVAMLAGSTWVGSLLCLAIVTRAARQTLDRQSQVALFQVVGKQYGAVGTTALLTAVVAGVVLAWPPASWSPTMVAAAVVSGSLVVVTAIGMSQARKMTKLRRRAIGNTSDIATAKAVVQGQRLATFLRTLIAGLTLVVVVLAAYIIH